MSHISIEYVFSLEQKERLLLIDGLERKDVERLLTEITNIQGAGIGAGVGVAGTLGVWGVKRLALRKELKKCDELKSSADVKMCKEEIERKIRDLNTKALDYGTAATLVGAGTGYGASVLHNKRADDIRSGKKKAATASEEERLRLEKLGEKLEKAGNMEYRLGYNFVIVGRNTFIRRNLKRERMTKGRNHILGSIRYYEKAIEVYPRPQDKRRVEIKVKNAEKFLKNRNVAREKPKEE